MTSNQKFWQSKKLSELSHEEWESLCDGCGKCCVNKLIDDSTTPPDVAFTWVSCKYLDLEACKCTDYTNRLSNVPSCLKISAQNIKSIATHLPKTCSYRLLHEGSELPEWHYLISGDRDLVHTREISLKNKAICESDIDPDDLESFIVEEDDF